MDVTVLVENIIFKTMNYTENGHIAIGAPGSEARIKNDKCEFEWDGEFHSCPTCGVGRRMNCRKCHKDRCDNEQCYIK